MRKINLTIVAAGLLATSALVSCSKQEAKTTSIGSTKTSTTALAKMSGTWRAYQANDNCDGYGINCYELEPIVIKPKKKALIAAAAASGNSSVVGSTFSDIELQDFCDMMEQTEATKLRSGNYFITLNHDGNTTMNYMVGTAFPVTAQNMEFAFQFTK